MNNNVFQFVPGGKAQADAERKALQDQMREAARTISDRILATVEYGIEHDFDAVLEAGPGIAFQAALIAVFQAAKARKGDN